MAADYSPASLAAAAGVDPWALARKVTDGRPDEVRGVGLAFRAAREKAAEAARLAGVADRSMASAYTNDGTGVWDVAAAARRTHGLLSENGDEMEDVARAVLIVGDELATTSSTVGKELTTLTDQIDAVIARRNAFFATARALAPEDRTAAEQGFLNEAVDLVRSCGGRVQGDLDAYDRVLASRTGFLADLGFEAPTTAQPGVLGPDILRTPPGARLEGGVTVAVPAPDGGLVLGMPPAPDVGTGTTDVGAFPFPVPDGSRVFDTGGTGAPESPAGPPVIEEGKQGKHERGHPNFKPDGSELTADADELVKRAGTGEQVGAVPVGEPGSKERIDFGQEIGVFKDKDGNAAPTTVGMIHYSKKGVHIVPARPR